MPRDPQNPHGFSERLQTAIDVVSALGEPEHHFSGDPTAQWGEVDDDYHEWPQTDIKTSSYEEVEEFYDSGRPVDIRIVEQ